MTARARLGALVALVVLELLAPAFGRAQPVISASPDVTLRLGPANVAAEDGDIAVDNQLGLVLLESLGPIPQSADVIGFARGLGNVRLFSLDISAELSRGFFARPGDVVAWNGSEHTLLFDADAAGIPSGVAVDAVSLAPNGILLSFDTHVALPGGLSVGHADLVRWDGTSFSLAFDAGAAGLDPSLDLDAVHDLGGGQLLMSFDTGGQLGSVVFDDEDVLRYANGSWSLELDTTSLDRDWAGADLDALSVPEPAPSLPFAAGAVVLAALRAMRSRTARRPG